MASRDRSPLTADLLVDGDVGVAFNTIVLVPAGVLLSAIVSRTSFRADQRIDLRHQAVTGCSIATGQQPRGRARTALDRTGWDRFDRRRGIGLAGAFGRSRAKKLAGDFTDCNAVGSDSES